MDPAILRQTAHDVLQQTCQRLIAWKGSDALPARLYTIEKKNGTTWLDSTPGLESKLLVDLISERLSIDISKSDNTIQAVLTADTAKGDDGRLMVLVTVDSPQSTFMLYRYYTSRGYDLVLEETTDSDFRPEFLPASDPALHFFDSRRIHAVGAVQ